MDDIYLRRTTRQRKQTNFYIQKTIALESQVVRLSSLFPRFVNMIEVVNRSQNIPYRYKNGHISHVRQSPHFAFIKKAHGFLAIFLILLFVLIIFSQAITICDCSKPYRLGVTDLSHQSDVLRLRKQTRKMIHFFRVYVTDKAAKTFKGYACRMWHSELKATKFF